MLSACHSSLFAYSYSFIPGFLPNYSDEIFTVSKVHTREYPYMYSLVDANGEPLAGKNYAAELVKATPDPASAKK